MHLWVSGREPVSSSVAHYTRDPVYEEEFALPASNPTVDCLHLRVSDSRGGHGHGSTLGEAKIHLSDLLDSPGALCKGQPLSLHAAPSTSTGGGGGDNGGCVVIAVDIAFPTKKGAL